MEKKVKVRKNKVYQRVRDLRTDSDLKQKDIAKILNCSTRVYSNYECGDLDIPTEYLILLSTFYGTSIDYLVGKTDQKKAYPLAKAILEMVEAKKKKEKEEK